MRLRQWHDVGVCAHIGRLFLHPEDLRGGRMLIERGTEFGFWPGVELFDEDDADVVETALGALHAKVVPDFAGADKKAARVGDVVVGKDVEEVAARKVGDGRERIGVAEHRLRCEDDERLAPLAQRLTAEQMEVLRGVGGLGDLDVVLRGELEVAFHACAGVFGPLAS